MKLGTSLGICRLRFEDVPFFKTLDAELNAAGYINTIFNLFGKNDVLDFDGSFQFGATARFNDMFSIRAGIHHFSGHYGDEMLEKY